MGILLSEGESGLQNSLYCISVYCDKCQLTMNVQKYIIMIIQNIPSKMDKTYITFNGKCTYHYKYLGCVITCNGSLANYSLEEKKNKAKKFYLLYNYKFEDIKTVDYFIQ